MGAIDIGPGATNRATWIAIVGNTIIDSQNAANDTGTLTSFEIWYYSGTVTTCNVAPFTNTASENFTPTSHAHIGAVTTGSKQTFSGLSMAVTSGDLLGYYSGGTSINMETDTSNHIHQKAGDQTDAGSQTFTAVANRMVSIYAAGATISGWANIAKTLAVASADMAKILGVAVADVAKLDGVVVISLLKKLFRRRKCEEYIIANSMSK